MISPFHDDSRHVVSQPPGTPEATIGLPRPPSGPPGYSFPLMATIAPVLGSGLIWVITQSPFALIFAALAPIVAVASLIDSRWGGRRHQRRERARFTDDLVRTRATVGRRHEIERKQLEIVFPGIANLLLTPQGGPARWSTSRWSAARWSAARWSAEEDSAILLRLGTGDARSGVRFDGVPADVRDPHILAELNSLSYAASCLRGSAIRIDARLGVGICGPPALAHAVARANVIRLSGLLHPEFVFIRRPKELYWKWIDELPHRVEVGEAPFLEFIAIPREGQSPLKPAPPIVIAVAESSAILPRACHHRIDLADAATGRLTAVDGIDGEFLLDLEYASEEDAISWARKLRALAAAEGVVAGAAVLPTVLSFATLDNLQGRPDRPDRRERFGLDCIVGASALAPWHIDLVAEGPHAVVGGTTGSGKSELLITWILALASRYSPREITFLLVDFKGGASFEAIRTIPHSVGIITDLDHPGAARALESLRAELKYRERILVAAGSKSIDDLPSGSELPRLIIVVDEYASLAQDFPELRELFADIAARGRSLGVHLILCTQRPTTALREAILANCTLRISLRVNNAADSIALIGAPAAAELARDPVGRAFVLRPGQPPLAVQVAVTDALDLAQVAACWPDVGTIRRPWCDPLPTIVRLSDRLPGIALPDAGGRTCSSVAFALRDLPEQQRQDWAEFDPGRHGNLLVWGARGSGKSAALNTIAQGFARSYFLPNQVGEAWELVVDCIETAAKHSGSPSDPAKLLVVDDLDSLVGRFGPDHQREFIELMARILRDGPARGLFVVASVQHLAPPLTPAATLFDSLLTLRLTDRQEHVLAGGRGDQFDPTMAPGGGFWGGHRVQVVLTPDGRATSQVTIEQA